jgi:DnaJ-domain-containing protein 1
LISILVLLKRRNREMEFYVVDGEEVPKKKTVVEFDETDYGEEFEIIDYNGAPDYYSVLGLDMYASNAEIKRAYRNMAYMYHPDKLQAAGIDMDIKEIHVMMRELNEAKDTLMDPYRRQAYDLTLINNGR